jgi:hypothetical protein
MSDFSNIWEKQIWIIDSHTNTITDIYSFDEVSTTLLNWTEGDEEKVVRLILENIQKVLNNHDTQNAVLLFTPEELWWWFKIYKITEALRVGDKVNIILLN